MCLFKCSNFMQIDLGCLILGAATFFFSGFLSVTSVVFLTADDLDAEEYLRFLTHLEFHPSSVKIFLAFCLVAGCFWNLFSALLILGIKQSRLSFVLCYFSYGVTMDILLSLAGLLVLLSGHWTTSLFIFIVVLLYAHCLIFVYRIYERMQEGHTFGFTRQVDEEFLIENDE